MAGGEIKDKYYAVFYWLHADLTHIQYLTCMQAAPVRHSNIVDCLAGG